MAGNVPNVSRDSFVFSNLYDKVSLQQGVPIPDSDWNEMNDVLRAKDLLFGIYAIEDGVFGPAIGGSEADGYQIAEAAAPSNNFKIEAGWAMVKGTMVPTTMAEPPIDHDYEDDTNIMGEGEVGSTAAGGTGTQIIEADKYWDTFHSLAGCRLKMTSGGESGNTFTILSRTNNTTFELTTVEAGISATDTYIIKPPVLTTPGAPRTDEVYVMAWWEDINENEDSNVVHPGLAVETAHRSQLRWCVRVAEGGSTPVTSSAQSFGARYLKLAVLSRIASANILTAYIANEDALRKSYHTLSTIETLTCTAGTFTTCDVTTFTSETGDFTDAVTIHPVIAATGTLALDIIGGEGSAGVGGIGLTIVGGEGSTAGGDGLSCTGGLGNSSNGGNAAEFRGGAGTTGNAGGGIRVYGADEAEISGNAGWGAIIYGGELAHASNTGDGATALTLYGGAVNGSGATGKGLWCRAGTNLGSGAGGIGAGLYGGIGTGGAGGNGSEIIGGEGSAGNACGDGAAITGGDCPYTTGTAGVGATITGGAIQSVSNSSNGARGLVVVGGGVASSTLGDGGLGIHATGAGGDFGGNGGEFYGGEGEGAGYAGDAICGVGGYGTGATSNGGYGAYLHAGNSVTADGGYGVWAKGGNSADGNGGYGGWFTGGDGGNNGGANGDGGSAVYGLGGSGAGTGHGGRGGIFHGEGVADIRLIGHLWAGGDPADRQEGDIWYDSTAKVFKCCETTGNTKTITTT